MEQNKTLLIILSVALFLAAILSVGLWFFYPREKADGVSAVAEAGKSTTFDPIEWVRTKEEFPALTEPAGDAKEDVIIVYGEDPAAKIPGGTALPAPAPAPAVSAVPPAPPAPKTDVPAAAPAKTAAPAPARPAPETAKTVTVREYSIQVGSFSSRDRAEEAGRLLKEKGLAGQILSRDVKGSQFYRLRIGPYTNKAEAEKFLTWVRGIQGFENSLIFEGYGTRPVAN